MIALKRSLPMLALVTLMAMGMIAIGANTAKDTKHLEAINLRTWYRNEMCEGTELYFSPSRGTLLVLCGIPESRDWGGIIYRITEDNGNRFLGDEAYECTAFVSSRRYWDKVLVRDGYMPLAMYPDLQRRLRDSIQG